MTLLLIGLGCLQIGSSCASVMIIEPPEPIVYMPLEGPMDFDVNGDGTVDFVLTTRFRSRTVIPESSNRALSDERFGTVYSSALEDGSFIGADAGAGMVWQNGAGFMGGCAGGGGVIDCPGNFLEGFDFLGVEFDIAGQTHYGWIEIESFMLFGPAQIHRWAYETEPGVGLLAGVVPEPSVTLLLLAGLGASLARRRKTCSELERGVSLDLARNPIWKSNARA